MRGSSKGRAHPTITSPASGIVTQEVGAIIGDLEIATRPTNMGTIEVTVRYAESMHTPGTKPDRTSYASRLSREDC